MIRSKELALITDGLANPQNYGPYADIADPNTTSFRIDVRSITKDNWQEHYNSILNIMKDGIYKDRIQAFMITVDYGDFDLDLTIMDYYFNLIMWNMLIKSDIPIRPKHIFFSEVLKGNEISNYINTHFINVNRSKFSNKFLNNVIADMLQCHHDIDQFAYYLSNTVNLEDTAELMTKCKGFYDCLHHSFSSYPMDEVKDIAMKTTKKSIEYIKDAKKYLGHDHCLADDFRTGEGLNIKQYQETTIVVGPKPNGKGGVFQDIIDHSFINGGVSSPLEYYTESSVARIAQIIKFNNVSTSGTFARILSLNNMDSSLYNTGNMDDDKFDCHTKHLTPVFVKSDTLLKKINLMYYRMSPTGIERCIDYNTDKDLIGKTVLLRTPMTCVSAAQGHGVCYKCYGKLAYTVFNREDGFGINIGRIALEMVTAKLTQTQLSTKHILEAKIEKITWCDAFSKFFDIEGNNIQLISDLNYKDYKILIDPDNIDTDNDDLGDRSDDDDEMNAAMNISEYITSFDVLQVSTGEVFHINNDKDEKLYITEELNKIIRRRAEPVDGFITISFNEIKDNTLFTIVLQNNEIGKILKMISNLYNKADHVRGKSIEQLFQEILDADIKGNLGICAVHYAVMLMNQIKDDANPSQFPDWRYDNVNYTILTLNEAINNSPSITITLSYQKIGKLFYAPLTYKKRGISFMDLFFMKTPQKVLRNIPDTEGSIVKMHDGLIEPMIFVEGNPNDISSKGPIDVEDDDID